MGEGLYAWEDNFGFSLRRARCSRRFTKPRISCFVILTAFIDLDDRPGTGVPGLFAARDPF
jgi:hypothetical protein